MKKRLKRSNILSRCRGVYHRSELSGDSHPGGEEVTSLPDRAKIQGVVKMFRSITDVLLPGAADFAFCEVQP